MAARNHNNKKDMASQQHRHLIIGGTNVKQQRYPYYVSIDKNNGVIVSGALIAPDIVLTAGHVILDNMDNLTIKIGSWAPRQEEASAETIPVQQYILHPQWNMTDLELFRNDYMIIQLTEPSNHTPIALNRNPNVPVDNATVNMMGLGWTMPTTLSPSTIVQETLLTCIGNEECESAIDPLRYNLSYAGEIDETMLCTISPPNTTHDGCAWDSGDPVILKGEMASDDLLVALGSSGVTCADPVFPATQARISAGMKWITTMVCKLSVDPPKDFECHNNTTLNTTTENKAPELLLGLASADLTGAGTSSIVFQSQKVSTFSPVSSILVACLLAMTVVAGVLVRGKRKRAVYHRLSSEEEEEDASIVKHDPHKAYTYESI